MRTGGLLFRLLASPRLEVGDAQFDVPGSVDHLIEAMRAGVKEFFSQPLKAEEVKRGAEVENQVRSGTIFKPTSTGN